MPKTIDELNKDLRSLRLSGMAATLEARSIQVGAGDMNFIEGVGWLVQDELDRRQSRFLQRRFAQSGMTERKSLREFEWAFNPTIPRRNILELGTLKFIDERADIMLLGKPGTGKSHIAKALALMALDRGYKVVYREAHTMLEELYEARAIGDLKRVRTNFISAQLLVIDDLFLRALPEKTGEDLADILLMRYEKRSTLITSNRPFDDWAKLLGDVVVVGPLLDRLMHHGHLLKFDGKSWRLKEAAERAKAEPQGELPLTE